MSFNDIKRKERENLIKEDTDIRFLNAEFVQLMEIRTELEANKTLELKRIHQEYTDGQKALLKECMIRSIELLKS